MYVLMIVLNSLLHSFSCMSTFFLIGNDYSSDWEDEGDFSSSSLDVRKCLGKKFAVITFFTKFLFF